MKESWEEFDFVIGVKWSFNPMKNWLSLSIFSYFYSFWIFSQVQVELTQEHLGIGDKLSSSLIKPQNSVNYVVIDFVPWVSDDNSLRK